MSFRFIALLALALLQAGKGRAQQKHYQVSAIAFYNFENLFDTEDDPRRFDEDFTPAGAYNYTEEIYKQKLHNLATVLLKLGSGITPDGPAIIGTAEIEHAGVLRDLAAQPQIRDRNYQVVHFDGPDARGIDVALMYHPKYFKVFGARALTVDISKTGSKGGRTRDVLHVAGILAGDTVHVLVNHWPSRSGGEAASAPLRAIAAGLCRRVSDSLMRQNPNAKIIIMGDLNDDPNSPSVTRVLGATGNKKRLRPDGLYNPFVRFFNNGIGSLGYNDKWNLFDQIIISAPWLHQDDKHWRFYKAEVFNADFLKEKFGNFKGYPRRSFVGTRWNNGYSDHFPTLIYLIRAAQ